MRTWKDLRNFILDAQITVKMHSDFETHRGEIQFLNAALFFSISFTFYKFTTYFYKMCVTIFNKSRENIGARKEECYFRNDLSPLCEITTQVDFSSQKALSSSYLNDLLSLGPSTHYSLRLKRFIDSCLYMIPTYKLTI